MAYTMTIGNQPICFYPFQTSLVPIHLPWRDGRLGLSYPNQEPVIGCTTPGASSDCVTPRMKAKNTADPSTMIWASRF